jgi:4-hydroxy-4-methyl-2-oxoglutarate aldolase
LAPALTVGAGSNKGGRAAMRGNFAPELLDKLRAIDTPTISNAIELYNVRDRTEGFMGYDVKCQFPQLGVMLGYAVTAICDNRPGPVAGRQQFFAWLEAIRDAPKPVVCVFQDVSPSPRHSCYFGEVMANCAKKLGAIGLVTDGGIRDVAEAQALGFHYFSPGAVCSHGNFAITQVNVPVAVSGVNVRPGDLIHGDVNGVLVIPDDVADRLPDGVEQIRTRERSVLDYVNGSNFDFDRLVELMTH